MSELLAGLDRAFTRHFGTQALHVARAPGRVNLIGEHTDYNGGFVLPCAIEYHTLAAISPREDGEVRTLALDYQGQEDRFNLAEEIRLDHKHPWSNYVRGVYAEMLSRGYPLRGCNIALTGNVPQGAGLSSSASLEMAVIRAATALSGISLDGKDMAVIGQAAENNFVGCACGIMDQLVSAAGTPGAALLIDCQSLAVTPTTIPDSLALLIINSNVRRGLVDSEYNARREQCEAAAAHFGKATLRELDLNTLRNCGHELDATIRMRAMHVLEENQRVLDTVTAFHRGDTRRISQSMAESHSSMRKLFEITTPEIDALVAIISGVVGERGGARMTGGGFGGCVVALLEHELLEQTCAAIETEYPAKTGLQPTIYHTTPMEGASVLR